MELVLALGCRTGSPSYMGWRVGTTTRRQNQLYPPGRDYELGLWAIILSIIFYWQSWETLLRPWRMEEPLGKTNQSGMGYLVRKNHNSNKYNIPCQDKPGCHAFCHVYFTIFYRRMICKMTFSEKLVVFLLNFLLICLNFLDTTTLLHLRTFYFSLVAPFSLLSKVNKEICNKC